MLQAQAPSGEIRLEVRDPSGAAVEALGRLRNLGLTIAVDDFGSGWSSLSLLKKFPIDVLKLDREFVAEIDRSAIDCRIVRTVVALGHTLGLVVVAEGIERKTQAERLAQCRVDVGQGYYYARPMAGEALLAWFDHVRPSVVRHLNFRRRGQS